MHLRTITFALIMSTAVLGCSSTQHSQTLPVKNGERIYPSMPILSDTPFHWNDADSEALNVVKMARPAGIGNSLDDVIDGTRASIGRVGGLSGLFDAALGFATSGVVGALEQSNTRGMVNDRIEFKPAIVEVINKSAVYQDGAPNYKLVRDYLAKKIQSAVQKGHPGIDFHGIYSSYDGVKKYNGAPRFELDLPISNESICQAFRAIQFDDDDIEPRIQRNFAKIYVDGENEDKWFCPLSFRLFVTHTVNDSDIVVVAELVSGAYFMDSLIAHYDGYVVMPDYYKGGKTVMKQGYAFVAKNGQKLLFQKH